MDLRRIRAFVTVAEQGSVSKASMHLRITQPALSRQIAHLQEELGLKLFDRIGRSLVLTAQGAQLLSECRGLLSHADSFGQRAKLIQSGDSGPLKVAGGSVGTETTFATLLHKYARRHPAVQVKLLEAVGTEVVRMLARGEIHVGICLLRSVQTNDGDFAMEQLQPVELLAACHPSFPLKRGKTLDIAEIALHPLLVLESGFAVRKTFDAACRVDRLAPDILIESSAPHNLLALAEAGHGVAIVSSLIRMHRYKLRIIRITHQRKPLREPLVMVWDKRRTLPHYVQEFRKMLASHMSKYFPTEPAGGLQSKES
jgi:DNA-binding transcriptional LysR family regulator